MTRPAAPAGERGFPGRRRSAVRKLSEVTSQGRQLAGSERLQGVEFSGFEFGTLSEKEKDQLFAAESRIKARRKALLERQGRPGRAQSIITQRPRGALVG